MLVMDDVGLNLLIVVDRMFSMFDLLVISVWVVRLGW